MKSSTDEAPKNPHIAQPNAQLLFTLLTPMGKNNGVICHYLVHSIIDFLHFKIFTNLQIGKFKFKAILKYC